MEQWRTVPGAPGYEVSDLGRVRSGRRREVRILAAPVQHRYRAVCLQTPAGQRSVLVQVLVLEAFVGPRPQGSLACHRDDDPLNNCLGNLYWGTTADNQADKAAHGQVVFGERHGEAKLTDAAVASILQALKAGVETATLAAQHGVTTTTIRDLLHGRTWKHVPRPGGLPSIARPPPASPELLAAIRSDLAAGQRGMDVAARHGVSAALVSNVKNGKRT